MTSSKRWAKLPTRSDRAALATAPGRRTGPARRRDRAVRVLGTGRLT